MRSNLPALLVVKRKQMCGKEIHSLYCSRSVSSPFLLFLSKVASRSLLNSGAHGTVLLGIDIMNCTSVIFMTRVAR
jgi:hypothetical protein